MALFRFRIDLPCVFCGLPAAGSRVCRSCEDLFPWNVAYCGRCAEPLPHCLPDGVVCGACQQRPPAFDRARAVFRYGFPVDAALRKLKFDGETAFAPAFAEFMLPVVEAAFGDADVLVPVPLHGWRHVRRGFNQAEALSRPLARATGLPLARDVRRVRATPSQTGLSAAARRRNLDGAFAARGFAWHRPLIVDDVITTGATVDRLARVLLEAGADAVGVIAVARAARR